MPFCLLILFSHPPHHDLMDSSCR